MFYPILRTFLAVFLYFGSLQLEGSQNYTPVVIDGVVYDDDLVASMITIITTTNPIPSIPSTTHIYNSTASLFRIPAFAKCKKIIVFDGIQDDKKSDIYFLKAYKAYKKNILRLTQIDPYFANTELVYCREWVHLAGAIKEAVKHVTTPFIYIHQHDFDLVKDFDLNGLIASMTVNGNLKHVRLNHFDQPGDPYGMGYYGEIDEVINGPSFVPLLRIFGWSDPEHVARLDYYTDFVLPNCPERGPMELYLNALEWSAIQSFGKAGHAPFGTYLYGGWFDGAYIRHTDGREAWTGPDLLTPR